MIPGATDHEVGLTPPLTTVRLPLADMGRTAAQTLLTEIDATTPNGRVTQSLLGVEFTVRGTTAPPKAS